MRIRAYSDVLLGAKALFIASDSVSRQEFRDYIGSLDLNRRYPGIQVMHHSQRVTAAQMRAFAATVRNDTSVDPRGYPDFKINPPGDRPEYVIVQYVEPMAGNEIALGLDLGGDAVRLAALERTRDSGQLTASGTIALALDPRRHPGFAMRVPVYRKGMALATVAQRREAFTGVLSASFIVIDLMRGVLSEPVLQKIHVRIHDAGFPDSPRGLQPPAKENLMFDSDRLINAPSAQDASSGGGLTGLTSMSGLDVGGRRWNLYFSARQGFIAPSDRWLPWAALLGGITISLLLFGLIRSLATTGSRAVTLANRITEDLRKMERRFRETFDQAAVGIVHTSIEGKYLQVNQKFREMLGYSESELVGRMVADFAHPEDQTRNIESRRLLWEGKINKFAEERRYLRKDGGVLWANRTVSLARDASGKPMYFIRVIEDIGERKQAELRQAMEHTVTRLLSEAETPEEVLPKIIQAICEAFGCACGARWLWDEHEQVAVRAEAWGVQAAAVVAACPFSRIKPPFL